MDEYYYGQSATDRGTLAHIKNTFNHRSVKKSVMDCFNHAVEFLEFTTQGLVCLLVMQQQKLSSLKSKPTTSCYKDDLNTRSDYLHTIAGNVVNEIWQHTYTKELEYLMTHPGTENDEVLEDDGEYPYCFCGEGMQP